MTHFEDDGTFDQGLVVCVTRKGIQRGEKTTRQKPTEKGLRTFKQLIEDGILKFIGYRDETYIRINKFWRQHRSVTRGSKPDPEGLLLDRCGLVAAATDENNPPNTI